jgi:hypothetical protein
MILQNGSKATHKRMPPDWLYRLFKGHRLQKSEIMGQPKPTSELLSRIGAEIKAGSLTRESADELVSAMPSVLVPYDYWGRQAKALVTSTLSSQRTPHQIARCLIEELGSHKEHRRFLLEIAESSTYPKDTRALAKKEAGL